MPNSLRPARRADLQLRGKLGRRYSPVLYLYELSRHVLHGLPVIVLMIRLAAVAGRLAEGFPEELGGIN